MLLVAASLAASQTTPAPQAQAPSPAPAGVAVLPADAAVLEAVAVDYAFEAPEMIPSGRTKI